MADRTAPRTELVAAAEKAGVLAGERAEFTDSTRRLPPEVIDAVREAGFARHFVSREFGGTEGTFTDLTEAVIAVGQNCASTAWCASLTSFSSRFAGHLPRAGQQTLWGDTPDTLIATGVPPMGKGLPVDGGHRLSGRWNYVSGVDFAEWLLLCALVPPADGDKPGMRFFAVPNGSYQVVPTWDSIGMRATGSHTVVVDDVLIPRHLSFDRTDMITGRSQWSTVASHKVPFQAVGGLTFIAPIVGAGLGALAACASALADKKVSVSSKIDLVRASGQVDAARLLVSQNTTVLDQRTFTPELMSRNERNAAFSADLLTQAATGLVTAAGTSGLTERLPLQRFWRDIVGAATHVALRYETASAQTYSAALIGS
jgi:alkylation response protein AidB-like acyl-CoA dehydrogenase